MKRKYPIYQNLEAEIARRGILKRDIAEKISVVSKTLSLKLSDITPFTFDEAVAIQESFFPDVEIKELFHKEKRSL